jgi:hypothetical protein
MSKLFFIALTLFLLSASAQIDMKKDCPSQVAQARQVWPYLPPTVQKTVISEAVNIFSALRVFRNTTRAAITQTLTDLVDEKVPAERACDAYARVIAEPLRLVQECVEKCYERANITWSRLITAIFKCRLDQECYMAEITSILRIVVPCTQACV